jgi:hypothetical protein
MKDQTTCTVRALVLPNLAVRTWLRQPPLTDAEPAISADSRRSGRELDHYA